MKVIFASNNKGKITELQALLGHLHMTVVPQAQLQIQDIPETGATFVENALLKARHACEKSGMPAIADDSGLVVAALNGAPGIFSARYAGEPSNAQANIEKLLRELHGIPEEKRNAYFYCALAYLSNAHDPTPIICEGIWHGRILTAATGVHGFGYDPVFYDPAQQRSAAELPLKIKNLISHRAHALNMLFEKLTARGIELCTHSP